MSNKAEKASHELLQQQMTDLSAEFKKLTESLPDLIAISIAKYFANGSADQNIIASRLEDLDNAVAGHTQRLANHSETLNKHQGDIADNKRIIAVNQFFNAPTVSDALNGITLALRDTAQISMQLHRTTSRLHESATNKISPPADDSLGSLVSTYIKHDTYKSNNGSLSFRELLCQAPDIIRIFEQRARTTDPLYSFPSEAIPDKDMLTHLIDRVYYPHGFPISGFRILIRSKLFTGKFTTQKSSEYALHIFTIVNSIKHKLQVHQVDNCWKVVTNGVVDDTNFQYSLATQSPTSFDSFWSIIQDRARIFEESETTTGYRDRSSTQTQSNQSPPYSQTRTSTFQSPQSPPFRPNTRVNTVKSAERRDQHEDRTRSERRDQQEDRANTLCTRCRNYGHTSEICTISFCSICHASGKPFMHDGNLCFNDLVTEKDYDEDYAEDST